MRSLARWLFLATIVVAPWLYGGTTAWSIELITATLGLILLIWAISFILERRLPALPRTLVTLTGFILFLGWWMVVNAWGIYDSTFRNFVLIPQLAPSLPGAVDQVVALAWMCRLTALLGVVLFTADLARRPAWLLRLWYAVGSAGGSIALLGLIQKGTGAKMIFWQPSVLWNNDAYPIFATFFYHANAGAYLNLILPVVGGLAVWVYARGPAPVARAVWFAVLILICLGIVSNTSRMAQIVSAVLLLAMIALIARPAARMIARIEKRVLVVGAIVVLLTLVAIGQAAQLHITLGRWQSFAQQIPIDSRWLADRAALGAVGDANWIGFGPGSFRTIFRHYEERYGNGLQGTWRFLHEDYLQTLLEWGWVGSALIAALFFGGIAIAARNYFKAEDWSSRQRILLPCMLLALVGVAIHAVVDFPLQILSIQLLVATYLGICWGSGRWGREVGRRKAEVGGQTNNQ